MTKQAELPVRAEIPSNLEGLRQEYVVVNENIRHYSALRFAMFTVYFAASGGLISIAFGYFELKGETAFYVKLWGRIGGFLVTLVFFFYEVRLQLLIDELLLVNKKLELLLGHSQIIIKPFAGFLRTSHATKALFWVILMFWIVSMIRSIISIS